MSDINDAINTIRAFGAAIQSGLERSVAAFPILAQQQINAKAKNKLHSTYENYMDAVNINYEGHVLIIELDKNNWLANATESGASGFDIKKGLLNSPKAKTGKDGQKYISVPMQKDKNRSSASMGTEKGQEYQRLIEHVMRKPKFGLSNLQQGADGTVVESQKLITDEPKLQGFYRFRKLDSAKQFYSGKTQGIPFQHVMFRMVSEKGSKTGATWEHPGIKPAGIFRELERELPGIFETLLDTNIQNALKGM